MKEEQSPIFIIGAARSGTNMLRDLICSLDGYITWDCDEINPIFRHGNLSHPNDAFSSNMATPKVKKFIRDKFKKLSYKNGNNCIVEKTCANTLRIPFLNEVFPMARYIFIHRDGIDVVASSVRRWNAPFDLKYTLKKVKYVPLMDLPYYILKFGKLRLRQLLGKKELKFWGVLIPEMVHLKQSYDIFEIASLQWKVCNEYCLSDFESIPENQLISVKYEELVHNKIKELDRICQFIGVSNADLKALEVHISESSVGKGRGQLSKDQKNKTIEIINSTQAKIDDWHNKAKS